MTKYVVSGYIGFDNFGDEAIAKVLVSHLKKTGAKKITLISSNPQKTSQMYDVDSCKMLSFFTLATTATTSIPSGASSDLPRALFQLLAIVVIFYLFFIRPQQKRAKEQIKMLSGLKVGDEVLVSGMIGNITKIVSDGEILVEFAKGVEIKVLRLFSEVRILVCYHRVYCGVFQNA